MSGILELGTKAISMSDNPLIRLEGAATICQNTYRQMKKSVLGFPKYVRSIYLSHS